MNTTTQKLLTNKKSKLVTNCAKNKVRTKLLIIANTEMRDYLKEKQMKINNKTPEEMCKVHDVNYIIKFKQSDSPSKSRVSKATTFRANSLKLNKLPTKDSVNDESINVIAHSPTKNVIGLKKISVSKRKLAKDMKSINKKNKHDSDESSEFKENSGSINGAVSNLILSKQSNKSIVSDEKIKFLSGSDKDIISIQNSFNNLRKMFGNHPSSRTTKNLQTAAPKYNEELFEILECKGNNLYMDKIRRNSIKKMTNEFVCKKLSFDKSQYDLNFRCKKDRRFSTQVHSNNDIILLQNKLIKRPSIIEEVLTDRNEVKESNFPIRKRNSKDNEIKKKFNCDSNIYESNENNNEYSELSISLKNKESLNDLISKLKGYTKSSFKLISSKSIKSIFSKKSRLSFSSTWKSNKSITNNSHLVNKIYSEEINDDDISLKTINFDHYEKSTTTNLKKKKKDSELKVHFEEKLEKQYFVLSDEDKFYYNDFSSVDSRHRDASHKKWNTPNSSFSDSFCYEEEKFYKEEATAAKNDKDNKDLENINFDDLTIKYSYNTINNCVKSSEKDKQSSPKGNILLYYYL